MTELITQARQSNADGFLFVLGSKPKMHSRGHWSEMRGSPGLLSDWKILQQVVMTPTQKSELEKSGFVEGMLTLNDGARAKYQFFQNESSSRFFVDFEESNAGIIENMIPASLMEALNCNDGLIWLSGDRNSGIRQTLSLALQKLNREKTFACTIVSDSIFPTMAEDKASFIYLSLQQFLNSSAVSSEADILVFNEVPNLEIFEKALSLIEEGRVVVMLGSQPSIMHGFYRMAGQLNPENRVSYLWRLAQSFRYSMAQVKVAGLNSEQVLAHEILQATAQVKDLIEKGNLKELELNLKRASESGGSVTMNQSILQNLIRRKIDIKTAFAISRDPSELDGMLKKVGI